MSGMVHTVIIFSRLQPRLRIRCHFSVDTLFRNETPIYLLSKPLRVHLGMTKPSDTRTIQHSPTHPTLKKPIRHSPTHPTLKPIQLSTSSDTLNLIRHSNLRFIRGTVINVFISNSCL